MVEPAKDLEGGEPPRPSIWRLAWPVLACLLFLAWSNIPPYRMHINDVAWGDHAFAWHWRLWEQGGRGMCEVRYFDHHADDAPIERWTLLGYERPGKMPDALARTKKKQLRPDYNRVCGAMREAGDPDPDVRVFARCGGKLGWDTVEQRKRNVCIVPKRKSRSKSKRKRRKK